MKYLTADIWTHHNIKTMSETNLLIYFHCREASRQTAGLRNEFV